MKYKIGEYIQQECESFIELIKRTPESKIDSSISFQLGPLLLGYSEVEIILKDDSWFKFSEVLYTGILEDVFPLGLSISFYPIDQQLTSDIPSTTVVILWQQIKAFIFSEPIPNFIKANNENLEDIENLVQKKKDKIYVGKYSEEDDE
jgi:hypothetical protein